jgi:hypothetical protein
MDVDARVSLAGGEAPGSITVVVNSSGLRIATLEIPVTTDSARLWSAVRRGGLACDDAEAGLSKLG